ncbi:PLP-dependent aminotransferase family protein [Hoeflea sp. WL0058]|uniref:PLP-dependent aminotransferase family protein n=1 Tax=Flavimaribacter sediminis TaxID=2865987 RepID=A0AAE2ZGP4_9HYPH|nr:PLP-dependent aminotransferase family protein [Flavimaribacter sediminis]MBW8635861.1 PLP-dependent aminotransferase family protein [Flavimaribacter sediminis]
MKNAAGALLSSIKLDRQSRKSISVQLYMALRDTILSGGLKAGDRLPATRTLAKEIGVSRTTVIDAIERLTADGMLVSRVGSGTYVSDTLDRQRPTARITRSSDETINHAPALSGTLRHAQKSYAKRKWLPHTTKPFVTAMPALDAFPMATWTRIYARHLRGNRNDVMGYGQPQGHEGLRSAIATHLNAVRGITCDPAQVFITSGAQHAFSLIGQMLLNAGDRVWMENPGASGARNALLSAGAELVPIAVDRSGLVVKDGLAKAPDFQLAFITPSHQQPLGYVMSLERRFELLEAVEQARALIIEDDYDGEFYFGNAPQPALRSIDSQGQVIYVGTFSKSLFPSLRLGFILAPERMVSAFNELFESWVGGPPTATQAVVADFMDEGHFATHIRMMRRLYKARYDALIRAATRLPDTVQIQETSGGFHTWARLDSRFDVDSLVKQARSRGVVLAPLGRYCLAPMEENGFVIGFGSASPDEIERGMEILGSLVADGALAA